MFTGKQENSLEIKFARKTDTFDIKSVDFLKKAGLDGRKSWGPTECLFYYLSSVKR